MNKSYLVFIMFLILVPLFASDIYAQLFQPTIVHPIQNALPTLISTPVHTSERSDLAFSIAPLGGDQGAKINAAGRYTDANNIIGDIYIRESTKILPNPIFANNVGESCINSTIKTIDPPNNTINGVAIGFSFSASGECIDLSTSDQKLLLDRVIRIQIDDRPYDNAFFFSPRENITEAQHIAFCDDNTVNLTALGLLNTTHPLKEGTEMCYVRDLYNNIIIISNRLGYFGAANKVIDTTVDTSVFARNLYQKIQKLLNEPILEGDPNVYNAISRESIEHLNLDDGTRYFGTYITITKQSPDSLDPIEVYNKQLAVLKYLEQIGAKDIRVIMEKYMIYSLVPIDRILDLSLHSDVTGLGDYHGLDERFIITVFPSQPIVTPVNPTQNNTNTSSTISITLPESMPLDNTDRTIDLNTYADNKIRIDTHYSDTATKYHINDIADITIHRNTEILGKTFTYGTDQYCYSGDLKVDSTIPNIDIPITPTNLLYLQFGEHSVDRCEQAPDISLDGKLDIDTTVYVRFADSIDKNPFYYANGDDNVTSIPKCSSANFDSTDNTLLDNTEICYSKDDNDIILVSKILAVFGVTADDISDTRPAVQPIQPDPPEQLPVVVPDPPEQPTNTTLPLNVHDYQIFSTRISSSTLAVHDDTRSLYSAMPNCNKRLDKASHSISMNSDGDISLKFSTKKDFADGKIFITIKNDSKIFSSVSLETIPVEESEGYHYTSTIPNNILDTTNQHLGISAELFTSSNTIHNEKIYSSSSTGSPLFYHYNNNSTPITIQLPAATEDVSFTSGTIEGINGTVYIPQGSTVSLTDDMLCQFGVLKPKQVAKIFDMSISASNSTDGLEVEYTFEKRQFPAGKEQRPSQIHWIATNSTDTITGNTDDKIKNRHTFMIPLTVSGDYDIILYGTNKQSKLLGTHSGSYTFVSPVTQPDPPEQPPVVIPDPPEPIVPDPIESDVPDPIITNPVNDANLPIISITLPESHSFDTTGRTIDLNMYSTNKIRIDTYVSDMGTRYYTNNIGDIVIFRNTEITNKTFTYSTDQYCYSGDLIVGPNVHGTVIPIADISNVLYLQFREHSVDRCGNAPDIELGDKLILDTNVYVRFTNSIDLNPFYYVNGKDDIVDIPKCTTDNFDNTTNTLKNIEICYGKDGNDIILVSKILAIFGTAKELELLPPPPIIILGDIIDYTNYISTVNGTSPQPYTISKFKNIFDIIPICSNTIYNFDHTIKMAQNGIVITYTVDNNHASDNLHALIVLKDGSSTNTLSLNLVQTSQNNTHTIYSTTIPNNIFNNIFNNIDSITSFISATSNTIHKTGVFSNSSTGSPLYYHNGISESNTLQFMQLPNATSTVQFVNGTNVGMTDTVHVPNTSTISLSDDILCRYASISPNNIADIFDINPNSISNTTNGIQFELTFTDSTPDKINWIAFNSTNTLQGNTIDDITRDYNLTIPLSGSGTYDIMIYGTVQDDKIVGIHSKSYEYAIPVIPEPPTMPITVPESMEFDNTGRTVDLYSYDSNKIRIDTYYSDVGTNYYINDKASITMFRDTMITSALFISTGQDTYCYVGDLRVGQDSNVPVPHTNTLQLEFRESSDPTRCDNAPEITFDNKLELSQEVYVRFAGTDGQNPFYHIGDDTIKIPKCTDDNFDETSSTLIDDTEICYGKFDNDTILVSKILAVFGTTADEL